MNLLAQINKEGKTVIVTTHNPAVIEKYGKRLIHLDKGHVITDTKIKDPVAAGHTDLPGRQAGKKK
jgi:ABC-type ATPase involved in cell division